MMGGVYACVGWLNEMSPTYVARMFNIYGALGFGALENTLVQRSVNSEMADEKVLKAFDKYLNGSFLGSASLSAVIFSPKVEDTLYISSGRF